MRKVLLLLLLLSATSWADGVDFRSVTIQHGVTQNGQPGLLVVADCAFVGYKGESIRAEAFFSYQNNNRAVRSNGDSRYTTPNGELTTQQGFTVGTDDTVITVRLFLPYSAIGEGGDEKLQAQVVMVWNKTHEELNRSQFAHFNWHPHGGHQAAGGLAPAPANPAPGGLAPSVGDNHFQVWVSNPHDFPVTLHYRSDNPQAAVQSTQWVVPAHYEDFLSYEGKPLREDGNGFFEIGDSRWRPLKEMGRLESTGWKILMTP